MPRPLSEPLDVVARQAIGNDWALYATLLDHWPEIVGQAYAQKVTPVKIAFPQGRKKGEALASPRREGGLLTLSLPQGLGLEFSLLSPMLLARINTFFGYAAIGKILLKGRYDLPQHVRTCAAPRPLSSEQKLQLEEKVKNVENDELRSALLSLGGSVLRSSADLGQE